MDNRVSVAKASSYEEDQIMRAVKICLDPLLEQGELYAGMKVAIKPNLLMKRRPEEERQGRRRGWRV